MTDALGSPWLAYAVLVTVTIASRLRCESWFAPGAFVGLVWSFFTGASLLVVDYPVPARGMWMLVLLIVAIQLGAWLVHELQPRKADAGIVSPHHLDRLIVPCRRYGLICTVVAMIGCIYFLFTSLNEFGLDFTPIAVLEVGARWTHLRYDDVLEPWSVRLLVMWLHPAALLGGILFACSRQWLDRAIGVITLSPALVYGVLTGARAAILLGLTCWIGGYVATLCVKDSASVGMFSGKRLIHLGLTAAFLVGMFVGIDSVRDTSWVHAVILDVHEEKLSNYMFGSPAAFADWYAHNDVGDAEWGARTLAGVFDLLRLKARVAGRYQETSNLIGTEVTNVYTLFRGLIEDFTETGALLIAACIGGMGGWVYRSRSGSRSVLLSLSAFYAAFLYSPIVSLFSFNGAILAWLVAGAVMFFATPHTGRPAPLLHGPEVATP
ncbi:MAG TPA: O-antigen polymerase [Candidatus Sulfotelmatobacter sp.]|jgi:oligosaccharide repeat unit polymerase